MELSLEKISHLTPGILRPGSIKNIIFDFGGVICNIDLNLTVQKFKDLGMRKTAPGHSLADSTGLFDAFETGAIGSGQFRDELRNFFVDPVTDEQLDEAWNALLLDIPEPRIRLLEDLRNHYRIFLLSNSNEIHYNRYFENFRSQFGYAGFDDLFEKAYFSFRIGLKKPSPEIFRFVMRESRLEPSETLFIDDMLVHVEGAGNAGIHAHHLALGRGEDILGLFK